jgi:O-antigen ligase
LNQFRNLIADYTWLSILIGAAGFLFLIPVASILGLDERYLVVLALFPLILYGLWKCAANPFLLIVFLVSATFVGGIIVAAEDASIPITPFQFLLIAGIILFVFQKLHNSDFEIRLTGFEPLVAAFMGIIFLSLSYSANPMTGLFEAFRIVALLLFVLLVVNSVYNSRQILILLIAGTVVSAALAAASLFQTFMNPELAAINYMMMGRGIAGRAALGDADPNFFATIFFLPIAFTVSILHSDVSKKVRFIAFLALAILIGGALSTYSRSAWVAIFFIGVLVIYYYRNVKIVMLLAALFMVLLAVMPDLRITLASVFNRILDIFSGGVDASSQMRIVLGQVAIRMFLDNTFLGVGFRAFPLEFEKRNTTFGMLEVNEPHNITYMIFAELGLVGFFIFALILFFLFRLAYRNLKISKHDRWQRIIATTLLASLAGYLIFHQFIPRYLTNNTMYVNIALIIVHHYYLTGISYSNRGGEEALSHPEPG